MPENTLIIFVKNEIAGSTKTRLAESIGDESALEVYRKLLNHTFKETRDIKVHKEVWYSQYVEKDDIWSEGAFDKKVQSGDDLGIRMAKAFEDRFAKNYNERVVIIGSDCAELKKPIVERAFQKLEHTDFVIGPAKDGGYYLLGMSAFHPQVFTNIEWSTGSVLKETLKKIKELELEHELLNELNDVDTIEDWLMVRDQL